MSQAIAYGSISIIDMTDLGEFSIQPTSNKPLSVIYNPDSDTYIPDWGQDNLIITPIIYYGSQELGLNTPGLSTTWTKQINGGVISVLNDDGSVGAGGERINTNVMTVTTNQFANSTNNLITYRVQATYTEPNTGQKLKARGQITFSVTRNATTTKNCKIIGDSVIKIKSDNTAYSGYSSVTLHADFVGVSVGATDGWQYQKSDGTWATYPGVNAGTSGDLTVTYKVGANINPVFINDKCVIKFQASANANTANASTIYDLHTITILRDGAAGAKVVSAVLTNEDQMIPVPLENGNPVPNYTGAETQILIYEGGTDVTSQWTIKASSDSGVTFKVGSSQTVYPTTSITKVTVNTHDKIKVVGMTNDIGNINFTCTKAGADTINKTFSLAKIHAGANGVSPTIYSLVPDAYTVNKSVSKTNGGNVVSYTPGTVTFRAYEQTGEEKKAYSGRYAVFTNVSYDDYKKADPPLSPVTSSGTTNSTTYDAQIESILPQNNVPLTSILVILFKENNDFVKGTELDAQSIILTSDGPEGQQGEGGLNVVFGNYSDILNCDKNNKLLKETVIEIPFQGFKGTTSVECIGPNRQDIPFTSVNVSGGIIPTVVNSINDNQYSGSITWRIPRNTKITDSSGKITIPFSIGGKIVSQVYSWTRETAPNDGQNAVILQIYTPNGTNVFNQSVSQIKMKAILIDGSETVSSGVNYTWKKWRSNIQSPDYEEVQKTVATDAADELTIQKNTVDSYASYQCTAHYTPSGTTTAKDYTAYFSLFDKTDPIQISVLSSIGEQIVNKQGIGALYVRVTRLGQEIDQLKSDRFLTSAPTSPAPVTGDYYYHLNSSDHTVQLKKWTGSQWTNESESFSCTYEWTWRDKDGKAIDIVNGSQVINGVSLPSEGKIIYIDGSMINQKIIADVEVTV